MNSDIGFLANVYTKEKKSIAENFKEKVIDLFLAHTSLNSDEINFNNCQLWMGRDLDSSLTVNSQDERCKPILVLYIILYQYLLGKFKFNGLSLRILKLLDAPLKVSPINPILIPSNNQWSELVNYFLVKYPHFERFEMRLPHTRNNFVKGIGIRENVIDFYKQLSELEIFGQFDVSTYRSKEICLNPIEPVPEGFVVAYLSDESRGRFYFGFKDEVFTEFREEGLEKLRSLLQDQSLKVITNDGKSLAKALIKDGADECEIHDTGINEKLIQNGREIPKKIEPDYLFQKYGLSLDADVNLLISQLYKVWEKQQDLIDSMGLRKIVELENRITWIIAKLELTGIGVDTIEMMGYQETLERPGDVDRYLNLVGNDDRIHDEIDQLGTKTGRFSCTLHSVPKCGPVRSFFKAKEGYKFVIADILSKTCGLLRDWQRILKP